MPWAWDRPVTLLIHGYNNTPPQATANFDRLLGIMEESVGLLPVDLQERSWLVLWQGYASIGGGEKVPYGGSEVSYPAQLKTARGVATALKNFIDKHGGNKAKINIIAHSLGCRAVLELLQLYALYPLRPRFGIIVLMAAAVPTHFVEPKIGKVGEKVHGRLRPGAVIADKTVVLFSSSDQILGRAFHAGQWAAGEGFFPRAVGRVGKPFDLWTYCLPTSNDHSDYFGDQHTAAIIAREFGAAVPQPLPKIRLSGQANPDQERKLATTSLPEHWLSRRRM
jgi:pimeloyl-ACP methyl ester carboxylesterase